MAKSADAFRTISEVADWLETPAHVLRFWESKFAQVKPVKRAGGRRYYRPTDMLLLGGIKKLLHTDGMTIKGVQKLLRENGVKHVSAHSQPLDDLTKDADTTAKTVEAVPAQKPAPAVEPVSAEPEDVTEPAETVEQEQEDDPVPVMPSFAHRSVTPEPEAEPTAPPAPKPSTVTVPDDPSDDVTAEPGVLTSISKLNTPISDDMADRLGDVLARLRKSIGANASGQGS